MSTTQTAQPAAPARPTQPQPGVCFWCESTEDVETFENLLDFDVLRDAEPPLMSLCGACRADVGIRTEEPDACSEHRAGCPAGAH